MTEKRAHWSRRAFLSTTALSGAGVATFGLTSCGSSAGGNPGGKEIKLGFASYLDKSATNMRVMQWWMDEVTKRSDDRISFEMYYSESLVPAQEMLSAVGEGRVDIGYTGSFYHASEWPLTSISEVPLVSNNTPALAQALMDLYANNNNYRSEFNDTGVHLLWPGLLGENVLGSDEAITNISELKGLSIRAGGLTGDVLKAVGANPVALAAPEVYQSMQRGIIDGYASLPMDLLPALGLEEVTGHLTGAWYGGYAVGPFIMNLSTYESLSSELRRVIDEVTSEVIQVNTKMLKKAEKAACKTLSNAGVTVSTLPEEAVNELRRVVADIRNAWISQHSVDGLNGQQFFDEYLGYVKKAEEEIDYQSATGACEAHPVQTSGG